MTDYGQDDQRPSRLRAQADDEAPLPRTDQPLNAERRPLALPLIVTVLVLVVVVAVIALSIVHAHR